jgi:hypothetical protein
VSLIVLAALVYFFHSYVIGFVVAYTCYYAIPQAPIRKRTYSYRIASMKTLRFLLINRAARLARISGRKVLRFSSKPRH